MIIASFSGRSGIESWSLRSHALEKLGPKNKKPTQLASGSNLSALLLWLQIRPSPSFMWVPKAKPVGIGVVLHGGSVLRAMISRKLFLGRSAAVPTEDFSAARWA